MEKVKCFTFSAGSGGKVPCVCECDTADGINALFFVSGGD